MKTEIKASELQIVKKFEGYTLARYQGNLGIWKIYKETIDWEATMAQSDINKLIKLEKPVMLADQFDDDCNHLLDPEWDGLFECRVLDIQAEMNELMRAETK
jgi:GH24 family phage-related lysozyme (muramidase)